MLGRERRPELKLSYGISSFEYRIGLPGARGSVRALFEEDREGEPTGEPQTWPA